MIDFKGVFYDARCLLQHSDPYNAGEPLRELRAYLAEGGVRPWPSDALQKILSQNIYLPTTFIFIAPFAMLPLDPAYLFWEILSAGGLFFAAFLMGNPGPIMRQSSPVD